MTFSTSGASGWLVDCCYLRAACICVVDCNQFSALQYRPPLFCDGTASSVAALRIFTVRRFAEFFERCCRAMVHLARGFPEIKKGCGYENENPCCGLLPANTFGAASCAETPRCICQDYGLHSRPGNSHQPRARRH